MALADPPVWWFTPTLANYWEVLFQDKVGVSLINSIIVAVCTTSLAVIRCHELVRIAIKSIFDPDHGTILGAAGLGAITWLRRRRKAAAETPTAA